MRIKKRKNRLILSRLDRYRSRKEWEEACWQEILKSNDILRLLTTPYERRNLVLRAVAVDRINSGLSYQKISEELWLSPQTISSLKKAMHSATYRSYRDRGKTERKSKAYSKMPGSLESRPIGRRVKTKYGTLYL